MSKYYADCSFCSKRNEYLQQSQIKCIGCNKIFEIDHSRIVISCPHQCGSFFALRRSEEKIAEHLSKSRCWGTKAKIEKPFVAVPVKTQLNFSESIIRPKIPPKPLDSGIRNLNFDSSGAVSVTAPVQIRNVPKIEENTSFLQLPAPPSNPVLDPPLAQIESNSRKIELLQNSIIRLERESQYDISKNIPTRERPPVIVPNLDLCTPGIKINLKPTLLVEEKKDYSSVGFIQMGYACPELEKALIDMCGFRCSSCGNQLSFFSRGSKS